MSNSKPYTTSTPSNNKKSHSTRLRILESKANQPLTKSGTQHVVWNLCKTRVGREQQPRVSMHTMNEVALLTLLGPVLLDEPMELDYAPVNAPPFTGLGPHRPLLASEPCHCCGNALAAHTSLAHQFAPTSMMPSIAQTPQQQPPMPIPRKVIDLPKRGSRASARCDWCSKGFSRAGDISRHKKAHCSKKPIDMVATHTHKCTATDCAFTHLRRDKILKHCHDVHQQEGGQELFWIVPVERRR